MEGEQDFEMKTGTTRRDAPVRPSMVVMTSKLLHVSEGIAAMNLRIAVGVFFCILLVAATFIVNVVAFDYAKDTKVALLNEASNAMMVDKDSGNPLDVHVGTVPRLALETVASFAFIRPIRELDVQLASGKYGNYMIGGAEELPCPEGEEKYCQGDSLLVVYATTGQTIYVKNENGAPLPSAHMLRDSSVLEKAVAMSDVHDHKNRHLLGHTGTHNALTCMMSGGTRGCS